MTLNKSDLQKFIKRLRKYQNGSKKSTIKYYAAGEYSPTKQRPHYHLIIFNVHDSKLISKAWPLGRISVDPVTSASVRYTCKYIDKSGKQFKHDDDRKPEFSIMSKKLGDNYLTPQQIKYHKENLTDRSYLQTNDGYKIPLPRYYRDKIFTEQEKIDLKIHINKTMTDEFINERERFKQIYLHEPLKARDFFLYLEDKRANKFRSFNNITKTRDL